MPIKGTYIVGLFPPTQKLRKIGMDVRKERAEPDALEAERCQYLTDLIHLQQQIGVAFYSDGGIWYEDVVHPVASILDGVTLPPEGMAGMSPVPRKNYYYAKPRISGEIHCDDPLAITRYTKLDSLEGRTKATLPGIFTFVRAAYNTHYTCQEKAMIDYAKALQEIAMALVDERGIDMIELDESLLVFDAEQGALDPACVRAELEGLDGLKQRLDGKATLALNLAYGDFSRVPQDLPADLYHLNTIETPAESVTIPDGAIALGVADSLLPNAVQVEEPDLLRQRAEQFIQKAGLGERDIFLVTNAQLVMNSSYETAIGKLKNLAVAAKEMTGVEQ